MPQISRPTLHAAWKLLEWIWCLKNDCNDMGRARAGLKSSIYVWGLLTHIHCAVYYYKPTLPPPLLSCPIHDTLIFNADNIRRISRTLSNMGQVIIRHQHFLYLIEIQNVPWRFEHARIRKLKNVLLQWWQVIYVDRMELLSSLINLVSWYLRPLIKWFLRQTTRLCELQRVCYGETSGAPRTLAIGEF